MTCTPSPRPPWSVCPSKLMLSARSGSRSPTPSSFRRFAAILLQTGTMLAELLAAGVAVEEGGGAFGLPGDAELPVPAGHRRGEGRGRLPVAGAVAVEQHAGAPEPEVGLLDAVAEGLGGCQGGAEVPLGGVPVAGGRGRDRGPGG